MTLRHTWLACLVSFSGYALNGKLPTELVAPIEKIFTISTGQDTTDMSQAMIYGELPSTCYKIGDVKAIVDKETKQITVTASSLRYQHDFCIQIPIPFLKVVNLGILPAGTYTVTAPGNPHIRQGFEVAVAKNDQKDDYLYAPVEYAEMVYKTAANGKKLPFVHLKGRFPNIPDKCMALENIHIYKTPENVVVVQPISTIQDTPCSSPDLRFDVTVQAPFTFSGLGVLHVRILNGDALSFLIRDNTMPDFGEMMVRPSMQP